MKIEYQKNYIYLKENDDKVGYIYFDQVNDHVIDVKTTYVDNSYRGQGIAGQLFNELITYCRQHHYQIIPSCSYIQKKLDSSENYQDLYVK